MKTDETVGCGALMGYSEYLQTFCEGATLCPRCKTLKARGAPRAVVVDGVAYDWVREDRCIKVTPFIPAPGPSTSVDPARSALFHEQQAALHQRAARVWRAVEFDAELLP